MRVGYWLNHDYYRLSVKDYVEEFCGWTALKQLIVDYATQGRDQAFLTTLFLTGGRVSEVLALQKTNFEVREPEGLILVRNMPLLKRYKKLSKDEEGKWITQKLVKTRKPFPIRLAEPLTPILLEWLEKNEGLLFPSPYKIGFPLSRHWAYHLIRVLDSQLPRDLKEELGLNKKFIKTVEGKQVEIADVLHLWLHWFRSQRASQLVSDYGYEVIDLIDYFSWLRYDTALTYARKGWRGLAAKMQVAQVTYV